MIINGKEIASDVKIKLKQEIESCLKSGIANREPGLAVILVGTDPASQFYVAKKQEACAETGIQSFKILLDQNCSKEELISVINDFNSNNNVDGILLQLPLPLHLKPWVQEIIDNIKVDKDVDGLSTNNLGKVFVNSKTAILPCTPKACIEILNFCKISLAGKKVLIIGRSLLVGKPLALILSNLNATVTLAHSQTRDLPNEISKADIVISAIGQPNAISGEWIAPGTVVIDVGINSVTDSHGYKKIYGDVDFDSCFQKASFITPVPGGVGPMTVAMLLSNTVELWKRTLMTTQVSSISQSKNTTN
ncbi:MAG: hypothetical protein RLZZ361_1184 [Cyanobacteriota bacterium]